MENVAFQTVKLNLLQRFELLSLIPAKSTVLKLIAYKAIKSKITPTQEEIKKFNIREEQRGQNIITLFKVENKEDDTDFNFTDFEILELRSILENASKKELISENILPLCVELQIK